MHVNVTIIGLDRLGTSFGLALKRYQSDPKAQHTFTIIGSDTKAYAMKSAEKMKAVDNFHRAVLKASTNADLLLVNVPFGAAEDLYARLGPELKPGAVVLDTSLLKLPMIDYATQYFPKNSAGEPAAYLVGITPIVNARALYSGEQDVEGARADLFDEGDVLLAPGGYHVRVTPGPTVELSLEPPVAGVRPAVDITLLSAVEVFRRRILALILTGMGSDGLRGARAVREAGGRVIAQDRETSVVYGMPRAVAEAGQADVVLPLRGIPEAVVAWWNSRVA
jgi:hypothetical protein